MRFRTRYDLASLQLSAFGLFYVVMFISGKRSDLAHGRSAMFNDISMIMCVLIFGGLVLLKPVYDYWEVHASFLRHRFLWRSKDIPFNSVVAVRPAVVSDKVSAKNLEVEVAKVSPTVYPHSYLILKLYNRDGFIQAIRATAPELLSDL